MTSPSSIEIPELALVVLVGASGSGKSTFAGRHFLPTEVVSSDQCRGLVGDDETDQSVTAAAFSLLHEIVDRRLEVGRLTVVDATNIKREDRKPLLELARKWDVLTAAIVFDLPIEVCFDHNRIRSDRTTPEYAIRRQHKAVSRSKKALPKERFNRVHIIDSVEDFDRAELSRSKLWTDRRDDSGPFDIIGDIHGCDAELVRLLDRLGYDVDRSPVAHPDGRRVVFLGDLVDRGPGSDRVLEIAMSMTKHGSAICVLGNHENKLGRALSGRNVTVSHGLAETLEQLEAGSPDFKDEVGSFIGGLVSHYILDGGDLVVAHAGLPERYQGRSSGRVRSIALYGDTDGETDEFGLPIRYPWAEDYRGSATVVYGHTPVPEAEWINNTICIDTGAVFGGRLTALRWPEKEIVSVDSAREYYEPVRPLVTEPPERPPLLLDVNDVLGKHHVETSLAGRITIDEERSRAAIEVMSRFAVDPRWLVHLPPTMAPAATSSRSDFLEHPDEAFAYFSSAGVSEVVCQEKHMGSRAIVIAARDSEAAKRRFGISNDAAGVIVTRTGRPFFADPVTGLVLLDQIRGSIEANGLWDELETDWLVLDAELLPWSAKALEILKTQYASTGAAATAMLAEADDHLQRALDRGIDDVQEVSARTNMRLEHTAKYVDAYRRYCWETNGPEGVEVAPFQLLAAEGEVLARRPHRWHLDVIDRLVEHNPGLFRRTGRRFLKIEDDSAVAEATGWWLESTESGGEGMVVKPAESAVVGADGLVLPGVKCRGREYLRIIYGPEYLDPTNLERLRDRSLGRKRSLARREFALGIEALDRFVSGEHLFRVHQCAFAVLALESEPVDPRL